MRDGDDPQWASPAYPVSNWREYNLGVSSEHQWTGNGVFWLRQTFRVPSEWGGDPLRCELQILAREVALFVNGTQLPLERDPNQAASVLVPEKLLRRNGQENHLALRIGGSDYTGGLGNDYLRIRPDAKAVPSAEVKIDFAPRDHVFPNAAEVRFGIEATLEGGLASTGLLRVRIENEFHRVVLVERRQITIAGGSSSVDYEVPTLPPGFYQVIASYSASGIESQEIQWFAVAPEEICCAPSGPADLAEFWQRAKAELAAVAPEFSVQLEERYSTAKHRVYTASMKSAGGVTLRAWYVVPDKPGKFPAVLHLPGYGQAFQPESFVGDDDVAHLALDVRGHGRSAGEVNPGFGTPGYVGYKVLEPENYIYRGAYLDGVRAIDFLCSRPEIDASRIAVTGPSQGGGLTIATVALSDGRVKCCAAAVPFLGDFLHHLEIRSVYIPEFDEAIRRGRGTFADVAHTMSYFDTVNLAPWIRCPVLMGSGLFDDDCPPHINFAVYNRLGGAREYRVYPNRPHNVGPEWERDSRAWLRKQFDLR